MNDPTQDRTGNPPADKSQDIGYLLTAYADGELNEEGRRWVEKQLLASPALRERHDQIRALQDALRRHLPERPGPETLEAVRANQILTRLRRDGSHTRKPRSSIRYRPLIISFLAASLMAAVVLGSMSMVVFSVPEKDEELPPMRLTVIEAPMAASFAAPAPAPAADNMVALQVDIPKPAFTGTPKDLRSRNLEATGDTVAWAKEKDGRTSGRPDASTYQYAAKGAEASSAKPAAPPPAGQRDASRELARKNAEEKQHVAARGTMSPSALKTATAELEDELKSTRANEVMPITVATEEMGGTGAFMSIGGGADDQKARLGMRTKDQGREERPADAPVAKKSMIRRSGPAKPTQNDKHTPPPESNRVATSSLSGETAPQAGEGRLAPASVWHDLTVDSKVLEAQRRSDLGLERLAHASSTLDALHKQVAASAPMSFAGPDLPASVINELNRKQVDTELDDAIKEMSGQDFNGPVGAVTDPATFKPTLPLHLPAMAPEEQATRLQRPLAEDRTGMGLFLAVLRLGAGNQIPLRCGPDADSRLYQQRYQSLSFTTRDTVAQALLRCARSAGLHMLPGDGVIEFSLPHMPLDPTSTFSLAPDAFRTAFGTEPMRAVKERPQITTALDGDTSSFVRAKGQVERSQPIDPATVRPEHFINAMPSDYPAARGPEAFALYAEAAPSPFPTAYPIARGRTPLVVAIGVVGRAATAAERRPLRLTLAVDASGSMAQRGGIERVKHGLHLLAAQLTADDRVAIVAFADAARVVLPATPGDQRERITAALDALTPAGSTNAIDGLMLAYQLAAEQAAAGVETRVVLASDGAALAGGKAQVAIERAQQWRGRGISLLVLGCGDERRDMPALQAIADRCDGQHVDLASDAETTRVFATTLLPARLGILARDAKLQVTWNPERVAWARLIGYDQRRIADKDFRNDAVDAGELNHETRLTALFEVIPTEGAAGPLGEAAVRYHDTRLERVRELACPMPGSVLAARANDRLRLLACAAETAEWLQRGWWSNVRLPQPQRIREVLATCPQPEARVLEGMLRPATP